MNRWSQVVRGPVTAFVLGILFFASSVCAAEAEAFAANPAVTGGQTILDMFLLGWSLSPVITAILAVFLFGMLFFTFHVFLRTRPARTLPPDLLRQLTDEISAADFDAARRRVADHHSLLAQTILPGLKQHDQTPERIHRAMENAGRRLVGAIRQEAAYLANIGTLAPMLGLLGTVLGLMRAFNVMGTEVRAGSKALMMSPAIGQAMITTAEGLAVGILAMGLYYFCLARIAVVGADLEATAEDLLGTLIEARDAAAPVTSEATE